MVLSLLKWYRNTIGQYSNFLFLIGQNFCPNYLCLHFCHHCDKNLHEKLHFNIYIQNFITHHYFGKIGNYTSCWSEIGDHFPKVRFGRWVHDLIFENHITYSKNICMIFESWLFNFHYPYLFQHSGSPIFWSKPSKVLNYFCRKVSIIASHLKRSIYQIDSQVIKLKLIQTLSVCVWQISNFGVFDYQYFVNSFDDTTIKSKHLCFVLS